jgi:hypothetical protein
VRYPCKDSTPVALTTAKSPQPHQPLTTLRFPYDFRLLLFCCLQYKSLSISRGFQNTKTCLRLLVTQAPTKTRGKVVWTPCAFIPRHHFSDYRMRKITQTLNGSQEQSFVALRLGQNTYGCVSALPLTDKRPLSVSGQNTFQWERACTMLSVLVKILSLARVCKRLSVSGQNTVY